MDIDVLASAVCSGLETATIMVVESGASEYERYAGEVILQSIRFEPPFEPTDTPLVQCLHADGDHDLVEIGLTDRVPEHYAVANLYVATHDISSYEAQGLSLDTIYTLDLYLWRDHESPSSIERKLIVIAGQVMRALKAAPVDWEMHPQQAEWTIGQAMGSRSDTYRVARFTIAATAYYDE